MSDENIFSALAKYNSATDENYLTECFAFVINTLLQRDRSIGLEILTQLCVKNNEFSFGSDESISVSTQETTEQGRPDMRVSSPDKLIYIEVKHDSPLGYQQLEHYKKALESSTAAVKRVVLLTRFAIDFDEEERPYKHVYWREVYKWLENVETEDPVSIYLVGSFKAFLEVKGMSIQRVGWEYINGIPAFNNLIDMIEEAIKAAGIPFSRTSKKAYAWDYKGFYMVDGEFWCGIHYNNPLVVTFELADKQKFNQKLVETPSYELRDGKERFWFRLPLEKIHFFSLDKDTQLDEITNFIKKVYAEAQKMRIEEK